MFAIDKYFINTIEKAQKNIYKIVYRNFNRYHSLSLRFIRKNSYIYGGEKNFSYQFQQLIGNLVQIIIHKRKQKRCTERYTLKNQVPYVIQAKFKR